MRPSAENKENGRVAGVILIVAVAAAGFIAFGIIKLFIALGYARELQLLVALLPAAVGLLILWVTSETSATDLVMAVIAIGTVSAGTLITVAVEPEPALGCINSSGDVAATVSSPYTTIYSRASSASEPERLLIRGCRIEFDEFCIGQVHRDFTHPGVKDARWWEIDEPDLSGLVASGDTVGTTDTNNEPDDCEGGRAPPEGVEFIDAKVAPGGRRMRLYARAPNAAVIGFALKIGPDRWRRLGWDLNAQDNRAFVARVPSGAFVGQPVFAAACIGFQRPIGNTAEIHLRSGSFSARGKRVEQPRGVDEALIACKAGDIKA